MLTSLVNFTGSYTEAEPIFLALTPGISFEFEASEGCDVKLWPLVT